MALIVCGDRPFEGTEAVILDKDGTLAHAEPYLVALAQRRAAFLSLQNPGTYDILLRTFGLQAADAPLNGAGLIAVGSRQENEIAAAAHLALAGYTWTEARQRVKTAFQQADGKLGDKAARMPLLEHAQQVLQALAQQQIPIGILSADSRANIEAFVAQYRLSPWIQAIRGADTPPAKPDPRCFQELCHRLSVSPQATLMIGDASSDMIMARQAGAAGCIGFQGAWSIPPEIDQADVLVQSWVEIRVLN
jgi:phosphoglycolate phosphatase